MALVITGYRIDLFHRDGVPMFVLHVAYDGLGFDWVWPLDLSPYHLDIRS